MRLVYRNNNYTVRVGTSTLVEGAEVYLCENIHTGVVEAEDQMLPRIIDYADQLDEQLIKMERDGCDFEFDIVHGLPSLEPSDPPDILN